MGNNYLDDSNLTKTYTIKVGKTINPDSLTPDHSSGHSVDQKSDVKNLLFTLEGKVVKNTPNRATVTVVKNVNEYEKISSDLKSRKYTVRTTSSGDLDVYTKPGSQQTDLDTLDEQAELRHQDTVTYNLIVPKEYTFSGITLSGGGTLKGNKVSVKPGENIIVTVHNTYSAEPYFHSSDFIKNIFKND